MTAEPFWPGDRSPLYHPGSEKLVGTFTVPFLLSVNTESGTETSDILRRASLLMLDSRRQCAMLGELQHAPDQAARAIEIGEFCDAPAAFDSAGITVADFTGLGVEDLYIAESCYLGAL